MRNKYDRLIVGASLAERMTKAGKSSRRSTRGRIVRFLRQTWHKYFDMDQVIAAALEKVKEIQKS